MMDTEPMVKMQRHCIENVTECEKMVLFDKKVEAPAVNQCATEVYRN